MVSKWLSERLPRDACLLVSPSASFVISMSSSLAQFPILSLLPVGECGTEQPAFALALLESLKNKHTFVIRGIIAMLLLDAFV